MKLDIFDISAITLAAVEHYKLTDFAQKNLYAFLGALEQAGLTNSKPLDIDLSDPPTKALKTPLPPPTEEGKKAEAQLLKWIMMFYEHEDETTGRGRYPMLADSIVWDKDEAGNWFAVPDEKWLNISASLSHGGRGFVHLKGSSLLKFMKNRGIISKRQVTVRTNGESRILG